MPRRTSPPPFWFELLVAVAIALVLRATMDPPAHDAPQCAWWQLIGLVASWIWKGAQIALKVAVEVLQWSVKALWAFATATYNALKAVAGAFRTAFKVSWEFLRATYTDVLKPAWQTFWRWYDKFTKWLDHTFGPLLRHLRDLRDALLKFWKNYIRPWLDLIDVTRKVLRVLASLGLNWARELDRRLAAIEERIQRPFTLLLAKVNEVIGIVNRVVTLDGLLQRVALVRSLARDYKYAWNLMKGAYDRPLSSADRKAIQEKQTPRTATAIDTDAVSYVATGAGPKAATFEEMYLEVRNRVRARP